MKFDYVICGAGTAGCVLANRLSEDPNTSVVLLEAGNSDKHPYLRAPAGFSKLTTKQASWGYTTTTQTQLNNRTMNYQQGKVLGGGSSINTQIYTRGQAFDYDNWQNNYECNGWGYKECLPYFKRAENNNRLADYYHNTEGLLQVGDPTPTPMTLQFVQACQQAGFPYSHDFNGADQAGFGTYQVTNRDGVRASASYCYLNPIKGRSNLTVLTNTNVDRICIESKQASSVLCQRKGRYFHIEVKKEVLVTAGAIGSPKLLLLSGLGPAEALQTIGIDVVKNIPGVGANLHDHMDTSVIAECLGNYSFDKYTSWNLLLWSCLQYALFRTGAVASNICDGGGFWFSNKRKPHPDLQFRFLPCSKFNYGSKKIGNGITLNSVYLRPQSRGTVKLQSNSPEIAPLINPNYWSDEQDVAMSVKGFKISRKILSQPALAKLLRCEVMPSKQVQKDDEIISYIRQYAKTGQQPVGSCRMGNIRKKMTVVAPDLLVKGVSNLRVCDSSIMPQITSSDTNAPTIMIAEKAADIILNKKLQPEENKQK